MSTTQQTLSQVIDLWARGDQTGALSLSASLLAEQPGNEQVALNHAALLLHREAFAEARQVITKFLTSQPASPALLANLSIALRGEGVLEQAIEAAKQATEQAPIMVSGWNALALAQIELGQLDAAETTLQAGLDHHPEHPALKHHLNEVRVRLKKIDAQKAWNPASGLLLHAGGFSKESNPVATEAMLRKAVHFSQNYYGSHANLGFFLMRFKRLDEARASLEKAHELNPHCSTTRYFLQLARGESPPIPAFNYVQQLFDSYAPTFDESLVNTLRYTVPEALVAMIAEATAENPPETALDLGCGTGLVGLQLAERVKAIDGIDLSPKMIEKSTAREVYRTLTNTDIRSFLATAEQHWDVMVAADVFIYCGDITDIIALAASRLTPGGWLAFSVETMEDGDYKADPTTGRYLHARPYVERLLMPAFERIQFTESVLRMNAGQPVNGWLVLAQKPH